MNPAWIQAFPNAIQDDAGTRVEQTMRFGLRGLTSAPWAQHIGHGISLDAIRRVLETSHAGLIVLDLPAGHSGLDGWPKNTWALNTHTRILPLTQGEDPLELWPAHRRKQWRRAEREGSVAERTQDVDLLVDLHQAARHRKGIASNGTQLKALLTALLQQPDTHAWKVTLSTGKVVAGGVFHGDGSQTCIYGFGGQFRSQKAGETSRATVLLLGTAMRHAAEAGAMHFDFGGSQDPGVDRFYAEFGAGKHEKLKVVRIHWPWRLILRWARPDLFPRKSRPD